MNTKEETKKVSDFLRNIGLWFLVALALWYTYNHFLIRRFDLPKLGYWEVLLYYYCWRWLFLSRKRI